MLLVGLGLRRLSMSPRQIPEVKTSLRETTAAGLADLAASCMGYSTAAEVQEHIDRHFACAVSPVSPARD